MKSMVIYFELKIQKIKYNILPLLVGELQNHHNQAIPK